jgi:molybdopterin-guanine dinucleotide biosynthesis protein A
MSDAAGVTERGDRSADHPRSMADVPAFGRPDITGLILCGGAARRMSGVEKALQLLEGVPMVAHVHARLSPQVARLVISANRELDRYQPWAGRVLPDDLPDCGPLGGIATALRQVDTPLLFCCPGDAPLLHDTLVDRLATALALTDADIAVPHDGARDQPLFALMRVSERHSLLSYLETGGRSVQGWLAGCHLVTVDASDIAGHFVNINTAAELAAASMSVHDAHSPAPADQLPRASFPNPTVEPL